jgi:hypothetical protein
VLVGTASAPIFITPKYAAANSGTSGARAELSAPLESQVEQPVPDAIDLLRDFPVGHPCVSADHRGPAGAAFTDVAIHEMIDEIVAVGDFEGDPRSRSILHPALQRLVCADVWHDDMQYPAALERAWSTTKMTESTGAPSWEQIRDSRFLKADRHDGPNRPRHVDRGTGDGQRDCGGPRWQAPKAPGYVSLHL